MTCTAQIEGQHLSRIGFVFDNKDRGHAGVSSVWL